MPSLPSTNSTLAVAVKKHVKVDIELFLPGPVLLDFSILFQLFSPGLQFSKLNCKNISSIKKIKIKTKTLIIIKTLIEGETVKKQLNASPSIQSSYTYSYRHRKLKIISASCSHLKMK